ncbi:hypothetical protein JCM8547_003006 [Rhodosporidiobolus lusitaniae]
MLVRTPARTLLRAQRPHLASSLAPAFNSSSARAFSLRTSSSSSSPPEPTASAASTPPAKPVLSELFGPTSLPDPTFFEPLSALFLSLPPAVSLSYATSIPLFTLLYRSTTTLPITLWQRRRTRRFAEVVMPLLKKEQGRIALETRDECRRAGKSYEEYQEVFKKKAKKAAYALARKYRCSPRLTLILPPLFHVPIFITATLVLRDACARASSAVSISSDTLSSLLSNYPSSILSPEALSHLHELASTPVLWCPSLVLPDPTMYLPLGVGLAALLNVEVTAHTRRATAEAAQALNQPQQPAVSELRAPEGSGGVLSAAEKRRFVARRAREGAPVKVRGLSTSSVALAPPPPAPGAAAGGRAALTADVGAGVKGDSQRIVTNMMRVAAVAFIPLAGMAPSAVCIYWVTSNLFTLAQNLTFWWLDRGKEKEKRMQRILSGKAFGI